MSEKTYKLELPKGLTCSGLDITKEQARSLREQCEAIEAQPEGRQWRDGDVVKHIKTDHFSVRTKRRWHGTAGDGEDSGADEDIEVGKGIYIGNLRDLLAQGEILIALKETELVQVVDRSYGTQLMAKLASYLADYRERRRHETTE